MSWNQASSVKYSSDLHMQEEEALERAREMFRRSTLPQNPQQPPPSQRSFSNVSNNPPVSPISSMLTPISHMLDSVGMGGDKLIILLLLFVLLNERKDKTLLMALGYLLLT